MRQCDNGGRLVKPPQMDDYRAIGQRTFASLSIDRDHSAFRSSVSGASLFMATMA
jgi:hypothetical protein